MKIEIDGNDSLRIEHKEEIHIFHKSMELLISSILNNNVHWTGTDIQKGKFTH